MRVVSSSPSSPVLVCDVLSTLVTDPFSHGMHRHFGFDTMKEFLAAKTAETWINFELGRLSEEQLSAAFFRDGRPVDIESLKKFLISKYQLIPGCDELIRKYGKFAPVHLCSNYGPWNTLIEETCGLEKLGAQWTFVSANEGVRKPHRNAYLKTAEIAGVAPEQCVLLDDREENCAGARDAGFLGAVRFVNAEQANRDLDQFFNRGEE